MSSTRTQLLQRSSEVLCDVIAEHPHLAPRLGPMSGVLAMLAADADGCTAVQLEQLITMQALLRQARALMPAPDLPGLEAALDFAPASPADYHFDVLADQIERLRQALIEVQAWLEAAVDVPQRTPLLREIWSHLHRWAAHEGRHVPPMW